MHFPHDPMPNRIQIDKVLDFQDLVTSMTTTNELDNDPTLQLYTHWMSLPGDTQLSHSIMASYICEFLLEELHLLNNMDLNLWQWQNHTIDPINHSCHCHLDWITCQWLAHPHRINKLSRSHHGKPDTGTKLLHHNNTLPMGLTFPFLPCTMNRSQSSTSVHSFLTNNTWYPP